MGKQIVTNEHIAVVAAAATEVVLSEEVLIVITEGHIQITVIIGEAVQIGMMLMKMAHGPEQKLIPKLEIPQFTQRKPVLATLKMVVPGRNLRVLLFRPSQEVSHVVV